MCSQGHDIFSCGSCHYARSNHVRPLVHCFFFGGGGFRTNLPFKKIYSPWKKPKKTDPIYCFAFFFFLLECFCFPRKRRLRRDAELAEFRTERIKIELIGIILVVCVCRGYPVPPLVLQLLRVGALLPFSPLWPKYHFIILSSKPHPIGQSQTRGKSMQNNIDLITG